MDCNVLQGPMKTVINDSLEGLTCVNQEIALFDFGNVVVQKDYFGQECVKIVSGSNYMFGEFVGKGMLTAAIQGETFGAPPAVVILRTIRELCLKSVYGVLIIVPGNSDILLNFGLAVERALNDNISVKLLAVNDNFHENVPKLRRRALSGVVFVNKIAGALSQRQKPLKEIFTYCETVVQNLISYEIELPISANKIDKRCLCGTDRFINDEPNVDKQEKNLIVDIGDNICKNVIDEIFNITPDFPEISEDTNKLRLKPEDSIVILLNNGGGVTKVETYIFVKGFVKILQHLGLKVQQFYTGHFVKCSPDIGLTITILKIFDAEVLNYLNDPCSAPGWLKVHQDVTPLILENTISGNLRRKDRLAPPIRGPKLNGRSANVLLLCTQFACDALISCEKQLNMIDKENGDGDTGTRLKAASEVLLKRMRSNKVITDYPFTFFESLSKLLEITVGSTMGRIYSTLFEAAANCFGEFSDSDVVTPLMWLMALERASDSLKRYGNVDYGDGTMFDPIYVCTNVARQGLESGKNFIEAFDSAVSAAEDSAQRTKQAKSKYPDSGAHAVGIWMRAVFEGVKLRCPTD